MRRWAIGLAAAMALGCPDRPAKPQRASGVGLGRVGDRWAAIGPKGTLHLLADDAGRPSAMQERIVELADGTRTVDEIARAVGTEFSCALQPCEIEPRAFIDELARKQVLVLRR